MSKIQVTLRLSEILNNKKYVKDLMFICEKCIVILKRIELEKFECPKCKRIWTIKYEVYKMLLDRINRR